LLPSASAYAGDPDNGRRPQAQAERRAAQLTKAAVAIQAASVTVDRLRARGVASTSIDQLRQDLQLEQAQFAFRQAVRSDHAALYLLPANPHPDPATPTPLPYPH